MRERRDALPEGLGFLLAVEEALNSADRLLVDAADAALASDPVRVLDSDAAEALSAGSSC